MIERMEEQVRNLTKSYRDELIQIEVSTSSNSNLLHHLCSYFIVLHHICRYLYALYR